MFLRSALSLWPLARNGTRSYSSTGVTKLVAVTVDDQTGIATVNLQRPPVNSLNLELLTELSSSLTDLEKNKSRGIILKSYSDAVFSAGIDILEMYKCEEERVTLFWSALQEVWIKLYGHFAPTVACINGHAPAGGCLLALSCEYRVMVKEKTIGLNETKLGIVAPQWFIASLVNIIGQRQSEVALTTGKMFTTEEALRIGLVDEMAENTEDAFSKSLEFFKKFKNISPFARAQTKAFIRESTIQALVKNREKDLKMFINEIRKENVQKGLGQYLESLKKRKVS
ncbi:hypothetical protein WA026_007448 [Henosepilachna vigintioctopunctata]|uniref:Enoyl-CoA delta isomerase 1, mitochondrial n=1 Tax=Henosepilachna vigintioctopunctata TaxID=420089 RepID=A0AAW1UTY7_9CUCU